MIRSEILGFVNMKCCLSGMPVLKLGLNDKLFFDLTGRSNINKLLNNIKYIKYIKKKFLYEIILNFIY